jgi:tRNA dimethylallyltransferase
MQSIGYRQLFSYFAGDCTLDEAIEKIKLDTRHFAKRQLTWFRRDKRTAWHDVTDYNTVRNGMLTELSSAVSDWMKG